LEGGFVRKEDAFFGFYVWPHILRSAAQWSRASESLLSKSRGPRRGRSVKTWLA
jgi:hypothetical protein